ncbi:MAG: acyl CoA:acetate/3-ketoacid CoA transferase [Candidatus Cyclobacteriaceae bacterium M3_2C_046]
MMHSKIITADQAISKIKDQDRIAIGGGGAGHAVPDRLMQELGHQFRSSGHPARLTIVHPCGLGDNDQRGLNHLAREGLADTVIGGFWGNAPSMVALAQAGKVKGYNFPQGVLEHLMRATAGKEDGLLTKTGLHTFVDPRYEGGKINNATRTDLVHLVEIRGQEYLFYQALPVDVALIRGTSIDQEGNLTMEGEVGTFSMLSLAQAAKANGGMVMAQVKQVNKQPAVPVQVKVPGVLIDYVVVVPDQGMTFITDQEDAFIDRKASFSLDQLMLDGIKKVIARRASLELFQGAFINLGYGMPDGVPLVAREEGFLDQITFMIEQGQVGGIISTGLNFGAMYNPAAILDDGYQFDFFHGGGLDICFLGFAQVDQQGNVNSSRFGPVLTGCGGFIDISQNTQKVVFCGAFATKGDISVEPQGLKINHPGKHKKFLTKVEQITFNGSLALNRGQEVYYCTERAFFKLERDGLRILEIAPGLDLKKDILEMMDFEPIYVGPIKQMDPRIFADGKMNFNLDKHV